MGDINKLYFSGKISSEKELREKHGDNWGSAYLTELFNIWQPFHINGENFMGIFVKGDAEEDRFEKLVAVISPTGQNDTLSEEDIANAALIARAPTMLVVMKQLISAIEKGEATKDHLSVQLGKKLMQVIADKDVSSEIEVRLKYPLGKGNDEKEIC